MPKVGDICHGSDLGKQGFQAVKKHIFVECPSCGETRWLILRKTNIKGISRCNSCCGKETNAAGYLGILKKREIIAPMASRSM